MGVGVVVSWSCRGCGVVVSAWACRGRGRGLVLVKSPSRKSLFLRYTVGGENERGFTTLRQVYLILHYCLQVLGDERRSYTIRNIILIIKPFGLQ